MPNEVGVNTYRFHKVLVYFKQLLYTNGFVYHLELLMKHGVSQERFFRSKPNDKGVEDVVFDIATVAHQHLEKSLALMLKAPQEAKIVFLPTVTTSRFLERLRRLNFNLTDKSLGVRDNLLPLALYWNKFRRF